MLKRTRRNDRITVETELREGDRVRVVHSPITRKYGVGVHGGSGRGDSVAWPGEVGVVTRWPYTAHDNTPMAHWCIVFDRNRRVTLHTVGEDYAGATAATFYTDREAEAFRRAK